jgi:hypothetical protein
VPDLGHQGVKEHILKGYSVNKNRLRDLNQAVRLITDTVARREVSGDEAKALLQLWREIY